MRYAGTLALLVVFLFTGTARAADDTNTNTSQNKTVAFMWSDILSETLNNSISDPLSLEETRIALWKEKQAHLWANLPADPFLINASAYTAAADECGKSDGITASGLKVTENRTLACPPQYPFGAKIAIEGYGTYTCEDRGGAIKGNHFDIYMETKAEAFAFGRRNLMAEIVQ